MRSALIIAMILGLVRVAAADPTACEPGFIVLRGSHHVLMSGNAGDLERVRKAVGAAEPVLWTRTATCKEYLVRDASVVDEIERAWKPADALGAQLGKLGAQEGKLGEQQGKLGEQQGALGERQGELGAKLGAATEAERAAIEREMRDLDAKMRVLDARMRTLDEPMRVLDRQMREVESKQEIAVNDAQAATDEVVARAIASGVAKPFH